MHILIIGAGPAGSSCAIQLLKAGLRVTLIDKAIFPRPAVGETVHPGIESILAQLDILKAVHEEGFIRHQGIQITNGDHYKFEPYNSHENWYGYQLYRESFDKLLINKAIKLGATFIENCSPTGIDLANGSIVSVQTSKSIIKADIYIDATGRNAFLAKKLKIDYQLDSPKLIAYYGYVKNSDRNQVAFENPCMVWSSESWVWIAQVNKNLIVWNRVSLATHRIEKDWLPNVLKGCTIVKSIKAVDVTWRIATTVSTDNYFLIGDAAFVIDPASSHGILKAIMSGVLVAHLINKLVFNPSAASEIHRYYTNWIVNWFESDTKKLKSLYKSNSLNIWG